MVASVVVVEREGKRVVGVAEVEKSHIVKYYDDGCVFALQIPDELWERIYVEFETARHIDYLIYGEYAEFRGPGLSVFLFAPPELLTFIMFVVQKGCAAGLTDSRGIRTVNIGRPCDCEKLKRMVDIMKETFIRTKHL